MGFMDKMKEKAEAGEEKAAARAAARAQAEEERQIARFNASPVGQARAASARGDKVFQYSHDVVSQGAVIVPMIGSTTTKETADPSEILNAVCNEGWDLVTGSFVFIEEGSQSRDKFASSGQNVAVKGRVVGYYLFKRTEAV